MVVLGEAGAGKTVLAVRFLLEQLHHRATLADAVRAGEPVQLLPGWLRCVRNAHFRGRRGSSSHVLPADPHSSPAIIEPDVRYSAGGVVATRGRRG
jgi:hypothetical protein